MQKIFISILMMLVPAALTHAQDKKIDKVKFFAEEKPIKAVLSTGMNRLLSGKMKEKDSMGGNFSFFIIDSGNKKEKVGVTVRGNYRRKNCLIPPIKLEFKQSKSNYAALGSLKLVSVCQPGSDYIDYLLTEYLVYKMYNLLTEKSFRVRLLELTYQDSTGKRKDLTYPAFLIEDTKDMAKRNNMIEWKDWSVGTEQTNREQMTLVAIFEYMIGNTDWSVPVRHNIRLIYDKDKQASNPYPVPYDFDYCGIVNASYAVPYEMLNLENIKQRLYRGYPRTMEELTKVLDLFREKKEQLYCLVKNFDKLSMSKKKEIISYLDEFYSIINNSKEVERTFIRGARTD